ncbi:MAG TPA: DUF192 domain-containing protein [Candidatus Sulfotelmatobacter sp.]|jgi:uncharacterized protein
MTVFSPQGQAFNRTRQAYLATELALADTHWSRLRGLMGASERDFGDGRGLWIVPCRGVHTIAMRFPIDVVYLSKAGAVVHIEQGLQPWRFAPIRMQAATVLELPSGKAVETSTAVGDKIEIKLGADELGKEKTKLPA